MADGKVVIDVILNDGSVAKGIANIGVHWKVGTERLICRFKKWNGNVRPIPRQTN